MKKDSFGSFTWKVISLHMITYMIAGMVFSTFFSYEQLYKTGALSHLMKDFSSPWIYAGPSLQMIRGFLFSLVLWPFYDFIFSRPAGWVLIWLLFIGFAILGTAGPSPGSFEGVIYTQLSIKEHLVGLPETLLQTLAFSFLLHYWSNYPKKYITVISVVGVALILLMSIAALTTKK
jgi:hypothetical protein